MGRGVGKRINEFQYFRMGKTKIMESGINPVVLQGLIQTSVFQCVLEGGGHNQARGQGAMWVGMGSENEFQYLRMGWKALHSTIL